MCLFQIINEALESVLLEDVEVERVENTSKKVCLFVVSGRLVRKDEYKKCDTWTQTEKVVRSTFVFVSG